MRIDPDVHNRAFCCAFFALCGLACRVTSLLEQPSLSSLAHGGKSAVRCVGRDSKTDLSSGLHAEDLGHGPSGVRSQLTGLNFHSQCDDGVGHVPLQVQTLRGHGDGVMSVAAFGPGIYCTSQCTVTIHAHRLFLLRVQLRSIGNRDML